MAGFVENVNKLAQELTPEMAATVGLISGVLPELQEIYTSLDAIDAIVTYKPAIDTIVENMDKISTVANDLNELVSEIEVVGADLQAAQSVLETVSTDLTSAQSGIKIITDNIENISTLAANINYVEVVSENIESVVGVGNNLPAVLFVNEQNSVLSSLYADKETLDSLFDSKPVLDSIYTDKVVLDTIYANKEVISSVYADLPDIETVAEYSIAVNSVAANVSDVTAVSTNIEHVNTVASDISQVTSVAAVIPDIVEVSNSISAITQTAANINNVNTVGSGIASIATVAASIANIEAVASILPDVTNISNNSVNITKVADNLDALLNTNNATAFVELELTGTAGQVNFGFNYTDPDAVEVFYNGRLLSQYDWYLSNNDTLTLTMPVDTTGDILTVRTWNKFSITDAVTDEDLQAVFDNTYTKAIVDSKVNAINLEVLNIKTTLANLSTAQGSFHNPGPLIPNLGTVPTQMLWVVDVPSTDETMFTINENSTITFSKNASFNFLSTVGLHTSTSTTRTIHFELVDITTNTVIGLESKTLNLPNGEYVEVGFSTLLTVGRNGLPSSPLTIKVNAYASDTGYSLDYFNSILLSGTSYDTIVNDPGSILDFENSMI